MAHDNIRYEVDDGLAVLTIDRPDKRNAMTYGMLNAFNEAVAAASGDADVRVLLLVGSGGAFCAGTDLSDLAATPEDQRGSTGRPAAGGGEGRRTPWPLASCPKPVVAAVDGPAVGMGAELSSQCDLRIASSRARFAWNFVHRGLVPDTGAGTWILPRIVGLPAALRLLYTGEFIDATEALRLGYVDRVVEPEVLMDEAVALARQAASGSPLSARLIKQLVYDGLERDRVEHLRAHAEAIATCFASEDHREGVASFLERRPPRFTGR
ncbi:MAG TPA: enoyl-CoA hydratase/isomerase family protein [Acidimicrobiales bacterium]|nr:enoyl-CoA hydratase/isomerase family protein [Acidimicrobiales bacterium]